VQILVKTPRGLENVAASRILELVGGSAVPKPGGFLGLVALDNLEDVDSALRRILEEVPEIEYALPILAETEAQPEAIAEVAAELAKDRLSPDECFAVRTTRRGRHSFTSIDVNVAAGAAIQKATGADVDLTVPDKVFWVEILGERAYLSVTSGSLVRRKMPPGKHPLLGYLRRISFVQMPYLGEGARPMGVRVGRAVQAFELGELVVAPYKKVDAEELTAFLDGLLEGREARYRIQKRTYARKVKKVPILVYDLYQLVRERRGEPIIATDPTGKPVSDAGEEILEIFSGGGRVSVLAGAREGLPKGVLRLSTLVIDLCPGLTFATEHTIPATVGAIATILQRRLDENSVDD